MYKQKVWKRVAVLFAGPAMNFVIGLVLIYGIAVVVGAAEPAPAHRAVVGETACVAPEITQGRARAMRWRPGPRRGRDQAGDVVVKVGDTDVTNFDRDGRRGAQAHGPTQFVIERDGQHDDHIVDVTQHAALGATQGRRRSPSTVGAIGVGRRPGRARPTTTRSRAVPATFTFTGDLAVLLGKSLATIPTKVGALVHAIGGGQRDLDTPISVVGAQHHRRRHRRPRRVGGVLVVPGAAELRPRRDQPGSAAAVRRRPHRHRGVREVRNMIRSARGMVAAAPVNTSS